MRRQVEISVIDPTNSAARRSRDPLSTRKPAKSREAGHRAPCIARRRNLINRRRRRSRACVAPGGVAALRTSIVNPIPIACMSSPGSRHGTRTSARDAVNETSVTASGRERHVRTCRGEVTRSDTANPHHWRRRVRFTRTCALQTAPVAATSSRAATERSRHQGPGRRGVVATHATVTWRLVGKCVSRIEVDPAREAADRATTRAMRRRRRRDHATAEGWFRGNHQIRAASPIERRHPAASGRSPTHTASDGNIDERDGNVRAVAST